MYDKKRDCIIVSTIPSTCRIEMNHDILEDLREALGLDKNGERKYTVKVSKSDFGYLNLDTDDGDVTISNLCEGAGYKTKFTQAEINELKQRDDVAIDWNKAKIDPVDA